MTTLEAIDLALATGDASRVVEVSAAIRQPGLTAIVGDNGSGKSSLLSLLAGQIAPTSGRVLLDGHPIQELAPRERARQVAWLAQSTPGAETFAVLDVVGWGATAHSQASKADAPPMAEVIKQFGLPHLADAPLGSLSGGERQRAHLARIWVQAAPITLLDEPDASLDETGRRLLRTMITDKVHHGHAIVIVTHDRAWANNAADHVWVMEAGRLTAQ